MTGEQFWLALAGILAWPAAVIVLVLIVLAFALPNQRAEVLRALADVVRAVRGAPDAQPTATAHGTDKTELEDGRPRATS